MGGFPSKGTPKDKRLKRNRKSSVPCKSKDKPSGQNSIYIKKGK